MDEEATRLDRCQFAPHMGHPIDLGQFRDHERLGPPCGGQQRQGHLVRGFEEIEPDLPAIRSVLDLEHAGADGFGGQILAGLGQRLGGFAAGKMGQGGEGGHQIGSGLGRDASTPVPFNPQ